MQIDATIRFKLGSSLTLQDLREVVEKTKNLPDGAAWAFHVEPGQRDAEYYEIRVQGASLLVGD